MLALSNDAEHSDLRPLLKNITTLPAGDWMS